MNKARSGLTRTTSRSERGFSIAWPAMLMLVLIAGRPAFAQQAGVGGQVTSAESGLPLPDAGIELISGSWTASGLTDRSGLYQMTEVPPGPALLRVRYVGHRSLDVELLVPSRRDLRVDLRLEVEPVALDPVRVDARDIGVSSGATAARDEDLAFASVRIIEAGNGMADLGVTDAVRGIPGNEPMDPGSMLYVRGAASDLKLVYLDGAPVYAPFPLGGLLDPFGPSLLERADIYLGGAPARYDGGLSYIMDLRTRGGGTEGFTTRGSVDLLSLTAAAEGNFSDRVTVLSSLRTMAPAAATGVLGNPMPYDYLEGLGRVDIDLGASTRISATAFANRETVRAEEELVLGGPIEWGNGAGSARLATRLGETTVDLTASQGRYDASIPLRGERFDRATGEARRTRASADLLSPIGDISFRYGGSLERQDFLATAQSDASSRRVSSVRADGTVAGGYAEIIAEPVRSVRVRAGGRVDHFSGDGFRFAPRVAANWVVTDRAALSLAAGRYHQYLRPPDEILLNGSVGLAEFGGRSLIVGSASHVTAGLDQLLTDNLRLGLEGYYKRFSGMPATTSPHANASGVDLWLRRSQLEGPSGWIGYSLAWVWSNSGNANQNDFSGRHILSTGLDLPMGDDTSLQIRFAFGAGLPYAGIPVELQAAGFDAPVVPPNTTISAAERGGTEAAPLLYTPDEPYIRFDAAFSRRWTRRMGGRAMEIAPFFRVINGLGGRDALFYFLDEEGGNPEALATLPMIPILGLEWKF